MDKAVAIALLGASISVIGWIANYILSTAAERRRQRLTAQLDFAKQQLSQLYGPLAFQVMEGRRTFQDLLAAFNRTYVFKGDVPLPPDELKTWLFWIEKDFFPRNEIIKELIATNTHLIEGETVPESWLAFLDHYNSWSVNHKRWREAGIEYSWRSRTNWPNEFENEVISAFQMIKRRHSKLLGIIASPKERYS